MAASLNLLVFSTSWIENEAPACVREAAPLSLPASGILFLKEDMHQLGDTGQWAIFKGSVTAHLIDYTLELLPQIAVTLGTSRTGSGCH